MKKQNTGVIYCLTNTVNGKQYIGQTVDFNNRIHKHLAGQSGCPVLSNAIEKYGMAAFRVEILEDNIPRDQLNKREVLLYPRDGYLASQRIQSHHRR